MGVYQKWWKSCRTADLAPQPKNAKKGDHDVLETHVGRPRCFDPMIYY